MKKKLTYEDGTEDEFEVDELGLICQPGKFEGEEIYVPFYYNSDYEDYQECIDSLAFFLKLSDEKHEECDENCRYASVYKLIEGDYVRFPELKEFDRLAIWDDSQGFATSYTWKTKGEDE